MNKKIKKRNIFVEEFPDEDYLLDGFDVKYPSGTAEFKVPNKNDDLGIVFRLHLIATSIGFELFEYLYKLYRDEFCEETYSKVLNYDFVHLDDFDYTILYLFYMEFLSNTGTFEEYLKERNLKIDCFKGKINSKLCYLPVKVSATKVSGLKIVRINENCYSEFVDGIKRTRAKVAVFELLLCFSFRLKPLCYLLGHTLYYLKCDVVNTNLELKKQGLHHHADSDDFLKSIASAITCHPLKKRGLSYSSQQISYFYSDLISGRYLSKEHMKQNWGINSSDITKVKMNSKGKMKKMSKHQIIIKILAEKIGASESNIKKYKDVYIGETQSGNYRTSQSLDQIKEVIWDDFLQNFLHIPYDFEYDISIPDVIEEYDFLMTEIFSTHMDKLPTVLQELISEHLDKISVTKN